MNDILQLKGDFDKRNNRSGDMTPVASIKKTDVITAEHISRLAESLRHVVDYWHRHDELNGVLVSVVYRRVIPKSSRITTLFTCKGSDSLSSICGSKFKIERLESGAPSYKHIFTHFLKFATLEKALSDLDALKRIIVNDYGSLVNFEKFTHMDKASYMATGLSRSRFKNLIADLVEVESFQVASPDARLSEESVVTLYQIGIDTKSLLMRYGISVTDDRILNETTVKLTPTEVARLQSKAPFLIAMSVNNLQDLSEEYSNVPEVEKSSSELIPPPQGEPIIGVIDTAFDADRAYFKQWVDYREMIPEGVSVRPEDRKHGTAISSIIVDGVRGNPNLEDDCGRFRVRHFGVLAGNRIDAFDFMRKVEEIVSSNLDIKVWNISCGSEMEINPNFISPEGALLDRLQRIYDVVFVVAGTNKPADWSGGRMRIGAPADSLNSVVVNATDLNGDSASYTREGPVLSFFVKPDVCYYGGESGRDQRIVVNEGGLFAAGAYGTSMAAPWIARKMAYLIQIMGLSREVAKALLIDAAAGWNSTRDARRRGYGLVPTSIKKILSSSDDEIRFVITGQTLAYETYTTSLPVPVTAKGHPFLARATMVYYPWCERNHGVDYTNTEMTLKFGRVRPGEQTEDDQVESINGDKQGEQASFGNSEMSARALYRKWDNVKRVLDKLTDKPRCRKPYNTKNLWGISVITKERGTQRSGVGLPFGIVVTLREIEGRNRIDEFIQGCRYRSWIVQRLNPDVQVKNHIAANSEVSLS